MKQFLLIAAIVGLAATGCAQNRVLGPQARRGGAHLQGAGLHSTPRPSARLARRDAASRAEQNRGVKLTAFAGGGCDDNCCGGGCAADSCCGGSCDDGCCASGCDSGCASGCCRDGSCSGNCGDGNCSGGCSSCGGRGCGLCQRMSGLNPHAGGYPEAQNFNPSPATGQVAYPYYTVRGPRDFLRNNPPSIGPY